MISHGESLYASYAPEASPWSPWVKPVLFVTAPPRGREQPYPLASLDVSWAPAPGHGTIFVVDLKGAVAVSAGVALARLGYRPVPLFNGVPGANAVVDVAPVLEALEAAVPVLGELRLPPHAPPAFLLDARRRARGSKPSPGQFDNRWVVFPQDFPSATFLASHRIQSVVVWTEADTAPGGDLSHVLRRWQEAGIRILRQRFGDARPPEAYDVPRPPSFRAAWYRVLALFGLGRAAVGGFGTPIPVPTETHGGFYG